MMMPETAIIGSSAVSRDAFRYHKRLVEKWPAWSCPAGNAFVLMADGSPTYVGVFGSHFSSISTVVPAAISYPDVTQERVGDHTNFTTNVIFEIDRAYPSDGCARGPDPRNDKRIIAAVEKLFGTRRNPKRENAFSPK